MKILVTGATGALGSALVDALRTASFEVIAASRQAEGHGSLQVDFSAVPSRRWWAKHLCGVDVVVNAAGIIRETKADKFKAVHTHAPIELFHACVEAKVQHVVQISALGADEHAASDFHRSKKIADDALRSMNIAATIVQPSLVYGPQVASTALFERLAALPWVALPQAGASSLQPVILDDVIEGLLRLIMARPAGQQTIAFVGPDPMTLRAYLKILRERQGIQTPQRVIALPDRVTLLVGRWMDAWPAGPFTSEALSMLARGNTAPVDAFAQLLMRQPRSLKLPTHAIIGKARHEQALLSLWLAPLRWVVALLWIWTGMVSLGLYPRQDSLALLASVGVTGMLAWFSLYAAAALDLVLGLAVFFTRGRARRWVWLAQLLTMGAYTAILSWGAPQWWIHPFGPLSKNLPVAALIGFLWALEPATPGRPPRQRISRCAK